MSVISKVSGLLGIDVNTLEKESLKVYLKKKMREYNAEILEICRTYESLMRRTLSMISSDSTI